MKKKKGKATAIVAMVALIALSLPVGATASLSRERSKATVHSERILSDTETAAGAAADLVTLSKKYFDAADADITAVQNAREAVTTAKEAGARAETLSTMTAAFSVLFDRLYAAEITEKDSSYLNGIQSDYDAALDLISRSSYNEKAKHFNQLLDASPARPLVAVFGIQPLELFQ